MSRVISTSAVAAEMLIPSTTRIDVLKQVREQFSASVYDSELVTASYGAVISNVAFNQGEALYGARRSTTFTFPAGNGALTVLDTPMLVSSIHTDGGSEVIGDTYNLRAPWRTVIWRMDGEIISTFNGADYISDLAYGLSDDEAKLSMNLAGAYTTVTAAAGATEVDLSYHLPLPTPKFLGSSVDRSASTSLIVALGAPSISCEIVWNTEWGNLSNAATTFVAVDCNVVVRQRRYPASVEAQIVKPLQLRGAMSTVYNILPSAEVAATSSAAGEIAQVDFDLSYVSDKLISGVWISARPTATRGDPFTQRAFAVDTGTDAITVRFNSRAIQTWTSAEDISRRYHQIAQRVSPTLTAPATSAGYDPVPSGGASTADERSGLLIVQGNGAIDGIQLASGLYVGVGKAMHIVLQNVTGLANATAYTWTAVPIAIGAYRF